MASSSALLTRREAAEIGRVPLNAIDKAIEQGIVKPKRRAGRPLMGGEPVITGTRVPVRTIASLVEMGETSEVLREDYPHIPQEAYTLAVQWAHANPRRGRPVRPWDTTASRPARERRATHGA